MKTKKIAMTMVVVIGLMAMGAQATISLSLIDNGSPGTGLSSYTVRATASGADTKVVTFCGITISGAVHQVWPNAAAGVETETVDELSGTDWLSAWDPYDTHFLIPSSDLMTIIGDFVETNDDADPTGLAFAGPGGLDPQEGEGTFGMSSSTDAVALLPAAQLPSVDFLQVVFVTASEALTLSMELLGDDQVVYTIEGFVFPEPAILDIGIDIRPGSDQNPVNLRSNGVLPVAILADAGFDVNDIELSSLVLDGATPRQKGNSGNVGSFEDVNGDGLMDLILQFWLDDLDIAQDTTELILEGLLNDGTTAFSGVDSIRLVGPGDVNADGFVDGSDLSSVISYWGQSVPSGEFGDLDGNGIVNGSDYTEVLSYWNPAPPEPPSQAIPEPAALSLLLIGGLALLRRRREA
ncbi:MAG: PEP-CTERM sorting domain-containing protein [Phycisphaerae bacterium]|nr:PEP-CTERM sorting domain-containing protein [Phycisphaerae bacterium]